MTRPFQVLVLDDDDKILRLLKIFMRQLGYQVMTGANGREGIQLMLAHAFDLLIVDVQMPEVDGFAFSEQVLQLWPRQKIIFCTGHQGMEVTRRAARLGIHTILEKPLSFNTLEEAIQSVCGPPGDGGSPPPAPLAELSFVLSRLRSFDHRALPARNFGQSLQEFPELLLQALPCRAAGVLGFQDEYAKFTLTSATPVAESYLARISSILRGHFEFFTGLALAGMPAANLRVLQPGGAEITEEGHQLHRIPLAFAREARGLLFVVTEVLHDDAAAELASLLQLCAHHFSCLLEALDQSRTHSLRDPLTGLYSKPQLEALTRHFWEIGLPKGSTLGLIRLDLNDFHSLNDRLGSDRGDEVLREIGRLIEKRLQPPETAARLQADEFGILLPGADPARLRSLAQSLVEDLRSLRLAGGEELRLSPAAGIAVAGGEAHGITSSSQLIECAEHARFIAKRSKDAAVSSWSDLKASGQAAYNLHPVLVVDDDPQICVLVKRLLNKNMYEVTGAVTVAEAVSLLERGNRYEIMLTDLSLPHQDGTEMIRLAHEIDPEMVPVVISGNISREAEQKLRQKGAFDILRKPFVPDQLRNCVGNALEEYLRNKRRGQKSTSSPPPTA